ncbi:hypothetical protein ABZX92_10675 [Lentzea sp. NPDC006480]|uniref:hypothetical protein n=1 Tax=Lentzea sp. NPDC006480 TaxID=3157176 RepID=UPI0033AA11DD
MHALERVRVPDLPRHRAHRHVRLGQQAAATAIRHSVRYVNGGAPTSFANLLASVVRAPPASFASNANVQDIAEVAALILTSTGEHDDLTGPSGVTFAEALGKISAATGHPIELIEPAPADYRESLLSHGVPEEVVADLNGMHESMCNGLLATPTDDIARLLGRPATSFDASVARTWH